MYPADHVRNKRIGHHKVGISESIIGRAAPNDPWSRQPGFPHERYEGQVVVHQVHCIVSVRNQFHQGVGAWNNHGGIPCRSPQRKFGYPEYRNGGASAVNGTTNHDGCHE